MFKKKRCQFEGTSLVFRTICFHFKNEKRSNSKLNIPSQTNCSIRYPITTEDMPWGRYKLLICRELMSDELLIKSNNCLFYIFLSFSSSYLFTILLCIVWQSSDLVQLMCSTKSKIQWKLHYLIKRYWVTIIFFQCCYQWIYF